LDNKLFFASPRSLGVLFLCLCAAILFIWIPGDVDSGLILKVRRHLEIGDSLAPVAATALMAIGSLLLLLEESQTKAEPGISTSNLLFVLTTLVLLLISFGIMRWAGPVVVSIFDIHGGDYRPLRGDAPWKYVGFLLGGTVLVAGLISLVERRLRLATVWMAVVAAVSLIALYDLPFGSLQLPPNADL
jgi:hypothetical protein